MKSARRTIVALFALLLSCQPSVAQQMPDLKSTYRKQEVMIPMRDGVRLFTSILIPKDVSEQHPIMIRRTPYSCGPYGADAMPQFMPNQARRYAGSGYIIVCQDVRGRYMSEGDYANVRPYIPVKKDRTEIDETTDTWDTVDWLVNNLEEDNGRVGISGVSYPGFYTWMGTIDAHPAVVATSPQAPVSKWMAGDDFYHNGAFLLPHAFNFYAAFGWPRPAPKNQPDRPPFSKGTPDEYKFFLDMGPLSNANANYFNHQVAFWDSLTAHDQWDDYWAARDVLPHLKDLKPATLVVGGWFDTENLFGALNSYKANERQSPGATNMLVMGPWFHGQWAGNAGDSLGAIAWGSATSVFFTDSIEVPFFDHWLRGASAPDLPEAYMFDTGAKQWRRFASWPPANVADAALFLGDGFTLSFQPPGPVSRDFDEYVNDPANPVPHTDEITTWYDPAFMLEDQRFADRRPDVLVYTSDVLTEDVTIAGPIDVSLVVSTSGTDADWIVKLIDVFPDTLSGGTRPGQDPLGGYEMMVRGDVLRGKFRNSLSNPEPFRPDEPTALAFTLNDAFHTFRRGHRIMVQIQSSWFPMIDRNPGTFMDIFEATAADFHATTQRVYRSPTYVSALTVKRLR